jgi:hypothetical protein
MQRRSSTSPVASQSVIDLRFEPEHLRGLCSNLTFGGRNRVLEMASTSAPVLAGIHELREEWNEAAAALGDYMRWQPTDAEARVRLVEAELRSGKIDAAEAATLKGVESEDIDTLLAPWIALGLQEKSGAAFSTGRRARAAAAASR